MSPRANIRILYSIIGVKFHFFSRVGAKKKVFKWLNYFAITNSYKTSLKKHKELSQNYDEAVVSWKNDIEVACNEICEEDANITKAQLSLKLKDRTVSEYQVRFISIYSSVLLNMK